MIEPGLYRAMPVQHAWGETKKGNDELAIKFEIYEIHLGETGRCLGALTSRFYFSGGALDITLKGLRTLGWDGEDVTDLDFIDRREGAWVDVLVKREIWTDPATGHDKVSAKIAFINPVGGGDVFVSAPLPEAKKESLKNRVRARLLASGKSGPTARGPAKAPPPEDDEIPF